MHVSCDIIRCMYKVYIVEDDSVISSIISKNLEKWGLECYEANGFVSVATECNTIKPHLVLLDINLPRFDGFYWCEQIRKNSSVPIIFISSRTDDQDKIRAMMGGGDDYIEKPFAMDVLIAKVHAMLRRTYDYTDNSYCTLVYKDLVLDVERSMIVCNGRQAQLTHNECTIMSLLLRSRDKVVSRTKIIKALWEDENFVDENTLTVNVARLRQKLGEVKDSEVILTVKGKGYRLA